MTRRPLSWVYSSNTILVWCAVPVGGDMVDGEWRVMEFYGLIVYLVDGVSTSNCGLHALRTSLRVE